VAKSSRGRKPAPTSSRLRTESPELWKASRTSCPRDWRDGLVGGSEYTEARADQSHSFSSQLNENTPYAYAVLHYQRKRQRQLAEREAAGEFIGDEMVEFESKELHGAIVAPTLRLLSGRAGWEKVEVAYQKALREIGQDPSDAITDAATALGPLADDARKRGLLAPYDVKILDWVSADRSAKGDAHNATPASRDDAWLAGVHVVGALILRLAGVANRLD
jgi:hypothetical protein